MSASTTYQHARRTVAPLVVAVALCAYPDPALAQHAPSAHEAERLHADPAAYKAALDDPARDVWQKPHEVVAALALADGDVVADIGSGTGYFAMRFARHVGRGGKVYAVDISPEMVRHLEQRVREAGLDNVASVLAGPHDPLLPQGGVDAIFVCDTWHHVEERPVYLAKLRAALKPDGRLVIVDFHERDLPVGPPRSMKLSRDEVVQEIRQAGFRLAQEHTFLPYQYFLVFEIAR
jgi:ubiquinone/menaquinone biosynthesis C-methylase UbiE